MKLKILWLTVGLYAALGSQAQHVTDTVCLHEVQVKASTIMRKEQAGLKLSRIDTTVLHAQSNAALSEVLAMHTPVYIKEYGRGAMATASFRGTAPSHTQVLWNGLELNNPMLGMVDFSLVPVYFTDDIELAYGAAGLQQQSGALGGSILLRNKPDWQQQTVRAKLKLGAGSFGTYEAFGAVQYGKGRWRAQTRAFWNSSENNFSYLNKMVARIDPTNGNLIFDRATNREADYRQWAIMQELYKRLGERDFMSVQLWWQQSSRSLPALQTQENTEHQSANRQGDNSLRVASSYKHLSNNWSSESVLAFSASWLSYELQQWNSGQNSYYEALSSKSITQKYLARQQFKLSVSPQLDTELKLDAVGDFIHSQEAVYASQFHKKRLQLSASALAFLRLGQRARLSAMLGHNFYWGEGNSTVASVGSTLQLDEHERWFVKAQLARNEHYPSLSDKYYQPGGNPELKAEQSTGGELGISFTPQTRNWHLSLELNTYYTPVRNWILWLPTLRGNWQAINVDKVLARGIELSAQWKLQRGKWFWNLSGNYAYSQSLNYGNSEHWADASLGQQLPYIPLHSGNAMFQLKYRNLQLSYLWNHYSKRYTTSNNSTLSPLDYLYPYYMNNLFVQYSLPKKQHIWRIELKVYNLLNEEYRSVLQRPMPGINFLILLGLEF